MVAGRGTKDQGPAHAMIAADRAAFSALIDRITAATIAYLSAQIEAGAEVVKLFDSWAGSLKGRDFDDFALAAGGDEPANSAHDIFRASELVLLGRESADLGVPVQGGRDDDRLRRA